MPRKKGAPPSPHYAISRIQLRPGIWFWLVAFRRRGKHYYKSFYDVRRGGPEQSLAAAIAWRDEQLARVKALGKREFCQLLRTTNTSGVPGVLFIRPANQPAGSWQARLRLPGDRILTRTFAVKAHGEREAYRLAVAARQDLLEHIDDTPFLIHPHAKECCAQLAAGKKASKESPAESTDDRDAP